MQFNSLHFLFFLPIVTLFYYLLKNKWRWILLFLASTYFYSVFFPPYILILYAIILIDYSTGLLLDRSQNKIIRAILLLVSITSNLSLLAYFKYYNFFVGVFAPYYNNLHPIEIILPIGLSFHTFQSLSYIIEVYKRRQVAEKHIGYFANYVLFFPQMIAGPIERFSHLGSQFRLKHKFKYKNISQGLRLILYGLFVKMCVADNLAPLVNSFYQAPTSYVSSSAWIALIAFSIQIYADFYGYSTIAIGAAKMLDIHLMDNFKQPYFAVNLKEFWQRWHISLSTWFRDYVFIPLGGSKVNTLRWVINIVIVFGLSGFWHGANYTFIIWGLLHALFYLLEALYLRIRPATFANSKAITFSGIICTFLLTTFIWIFFRSPDLSIARQVFLQCLQYSFEATKQVNLPPGQLVMVTLFILLEILLIQNRFDVFLQHKSMPVRWICYIILSISILLFSGIQSFQFIYFQF